MSFIDCILTNKALAPKQGERLVAEYNELFERYKGTMGDVLAAQAAAKKYVEIQEKILAKKNENAVRDVLAWQDITRNIDREAGRIDYEKSKAGRGRFLWGKSSVAMAVRGFLEKTYVRQQSLERRATLAIAEQIEKYRSKTAGLRQDAEGFKNVVRAMLGEKTGNTEANNDGAAIRGVFDMLHRMYEQAGGILGKLDNYFPQSHNPVKVGGAGFEQWRDFILPLLDREKMIDPLTGIPMRDDRLQAALFESYEGIKSNGLNEIARRAEEGLQTFGRGGGVALRHSSSRFLHFKDADSYLRYNQQFGYGDNGLFDAMMGHIGTMTRDIAIMQDMGPNPAAQMERLKLKTTADNAAPQAIKTIQGMYDVLAGRTSYNGELPLWYRAVVATQDVLRSALLGGAPVSAMSDSFYGAWTAKMNGIPATKVMGEYFKIMNPANSADRRIAKRIGFIASAATGHSLQQARFADDLGSRGLAGWLSSFTNRASGLAIMTDAIRQSSVLGTQGFMAEARAMRMGWNKLPQEMRDAFARWDMGEAEYKDIVSTTPHADPETGAEFIRPEDVAIEGHSDTARKYEMWLVDMAQTASNEPRLLTRAISTGAILGDARPGTALRATASSIAMFKSFAITVVLNHMLPSLRHAATANGIDRLARIAPVLIGTTILGAAAIQARQVLYGKTTRDMSDRKFWMAAAAQGGGFGIFGDYLFNDYSRFNQSFLTTFAGPMFGLVNDAARVFKGNFDRALDENDESRFFSDLYQFAERNIPAAKLWYTRLLLERLVLDQAERMIDPNFDTRMRRIEGKMQKEYGQQFWWSPGRTTPEALVQ